MTKRKKAGAVVRKKATTTKHKGQKSQQTSTSPHAQRANPKQRGIHRDAIQAGVAPTSASTCIACDQKIERHAARWGIKYAGNPLNIPVLPLYGSHPMVQWCHAGGCGLAFVRFNETISQSPAARTCHACQDAPDESTTEKDPLRLLCGAPSKGKKIRHHVFHISCWIRCIQEGCDSSLHPQLLVKPEVIVQTKKQKKLGGLSWDDLTTREQELVRKHFHNLGI